MFHWEGRESTLQHFNSGADLQSGLLYLTIYHSPIFNTVGHLCQQPKNRIQHFRLIEGENVYPQLQWWCCGEYSIKRNIEQKKRLEMNVISRQLLKGGNDWGRVCGSLLRSALWSRTADQCNRLPKGVMIIKMNICDYCVVQN